MKNMWSESTLKQELRWISYAIRAFDLTHLDQEVQKNVFGLSVSAGVTGWSKTLRRIKSEIKTEVHELLRF
ncbi:hypothetical protein AMELA_G00165100 [Ameiurus melas]|uniref:Uncharacterized protein n=1 Tax=Ameiurus melas TaxID=219545 RepID=A0A7J6AFW9_AMEME|nr:hypothetical protein AMELA_G00165100 [Ameiurus melas]